MRRFDKLDIRHEICYALRHRLSHFQRFCKNKVKLYQINSFRTCMHSFTCSRNLSLLCRLCEVSHTRKRIAVACPTFISTAGRIPWSITVSTSNQEIFSLSKPRLRPVPLSKPFTVKLYR